MRDLKKTYQLWNRFGKDCEVHRFYMDVCDFLRQYRFITLDGLSRYLDVSIDTVKNWSTGRCLPDDHNAEKLIIIFKEVAHGNCYHLWKTVRKDHFNINA